MQRKRPMKAKVPTVPESRSVADSLAHKGATLVHVFCPICKSCGPTSAFPQVPGLLCAHKRITGESTHPALRPPTSTQSLRTLCHVPHQGAFHHPNQQFSQCHTLSHYWPFSLSFYHGCTVEFSRECATYDDICHRFDGNGLCLCIPCFKSFPVSISKMLTNYRYNPQKHKQKLF